MKFYWVDGSTVSVRAENGEVVISANREGLLSLANHFLTLSESFAGDHFHLDEYNSLEDGSLELIVEKTK